LTHAAKHAGGRGGFLEALYDKLGDDEVQLGTPERAKVNGAIVAISKRHGFCAGRILPIEFAVNCV